MHFWNSPSSSVAHRAKRVAQAARKQFRLGDGGEVAANGVFSPGGDVVVALSELARWLRERDSFAVEDADRGGDRSGYQTPARRAGRPSRTASTSSCASRWRSSTGASWVESTCPWRSHSPTRCSNPRHNQRARLPRLARSRRHKPAYAGRPERPRTQQAVWQTTRPAATAPLASRRPATPGIAKRSGRLGGRESRSLTSRSLLPAAIRAGEWTDRGVSEAGGCATVAPQSRSDSQRPRAVARRSKRRKLGGIARRYWLPGGFESLQR